MLNNCPKCKKEVGITDIQVTVVTMHTGDFYLVQCCNCDHQIQFSSVTYEEISEVGGLLEIIVKAKWNLASEVRDG